MKNIKNKIRLGVLIGTLALTVVPSFGKIYGVIEGEGVKGYASAGVQNREFKPGATIEVTSTGVKEGIYAVEAEGIASYIQADCIKVYKVKGKTTVDGAVIRKSPDGNSGILKTLGKGVPVNILYQRGNWYEVALADGTKGYIYGSQVIGQGVELLPEKEIIQVAPVEVISWSSANKVVPRGAVVTIEDVYTGEKFQVKRTFGTNHADVEALTQADTQKIRKIWGGFTWERRPVIVHTNGRRLAASLAGMPHAGDSLDAVKGNGMSGVIDLHFQGSRKHKEGNISATVDPLHQNAIKIAAKYQGK